MKKLFALMLMCVALTSCVERVVFNDPAFQATLDGQLWRAVDYRAEVRPDETVAIKAFNRFETLTIELPTLEPGTYPIGTSMASRVIMLINISGEEVFFGTGANYGSGEVVIEEIAGNRLKGSFRFSALNVAQNPLAGENMIVNEGIMFNIPIVPVLED